MKWFRAHIHHGVGLALVALLIQTVLSFGHIHPIVPADGWQLGQHRLAQLIHTGHALSSSAKLSSLSGTTALPSVPAPNGSHHGHICPICAAVAMTGIVIFPSPPHLRLPQSATVSELTTVAYVVDRDHAEVAFRSRAPPAL